LAVKGAVVSGPVTQIKKINKQTKKEIVQIGQREIINGTWVHDKTEMSTQRSNKYTKEK
jgi:LysM repeat protein